jgi:hypothetical protein
MPGARRRPDEVADLERMGLRRLGTDPQLARSLEDVEDLLGVLVDVDRRRFARFEDDEEGL